MERGPGSRAGRRLLAPPGRHAQRLGPQLSGRSRPRPQWLQGPLQPRAGAPPFATLSGSRASTCLGPGHNRPPSGSQGTGTSALSSSLNSLKLLFAGALSAVVSRTCVAPLERVKMELVSAAEVQALACVRMRGNACLRASNAPVTCAPSHKGARLLHVCVCGAGAEAEHWRRPVNGCECVQSRRPGRLLEGQCPERAADGAVQGVRACRLCGGV